MLVCVGGGRVRTCLPAVGGYVGTGHKVRPSVGPSRAHGRTGLTAHKPPHRKPLFAVVENTSPGSALQHARRNTYIH
eukprot:4946067-Prymnesium_polylepis.1